MIYELHVMCSLVDLNLLRVLDTNLLDPGLACVDLEDHSLYQKFIFKIIQTCFSLFPVLHRECSSLGYIWTVDIGLGSSVVIAPD